MRGKCSNQLSRCSGRSRSSGLDRSRVECADPQLEKRGKKRGEADRERGASFLPLRSFRRSSINETRLQSRRMSNKYVPPVPWPPSLFHGRLLSPRTCARSLPPFLPLPLPLPPPNPPNPPTIHPSIHPSILPSFLPSFLPSIHPSFLPSFLPSFPPFPHFLPPPAVLPSVPRLRG
jgi:hypothetical protein